ncbi:MAG: hypothetical protein GY847_00505 [Proteobacteria bacterium]|nr:hypothetical protein [Pseudomonadota bacterium]
MRTTILFILAFLITGCPQKSPEFPPEARPPEYVPLNPMLAEIPLPAVLVGEEKQKLSGGCFMEMGSQTVESIDEFSRHHMESDEFKAGFKLGFTNALVSVGLEPSVAESWVSGWTFEASGITQTEVKLEDVRPDFTNEACTEEALAWFTDNRKVIISALKAKTVKVAAVSKMENEKKLKLEAAVEKIKLGGGVEFSSADGVEDGFELSATDVYFGYIPPTREVATRCKAEFESDGSHKLCEEYKVTITTDPDIPDRFTFTVARSGISEQYSEEYNRPKWRPLGELRAVNIDLSKDLKGTFEVLMMGVSASEGESGGD